MSTFKIKSIERYKYQGKVYNTEVEPSHPIKDDQFYLHADNGLIVHNCHPRDNIALRYLAEKLDLGYDIFNTVMQAREQQAKNIAKYLSDLQELTDLLIVIHGKAYKPDVDILDGSYSLLIGSYLTEMGAKYVYSDPLTSDNVTNGTIAIVLLAHNRQITYGYTGEQSAQQLYYELGKGSVVVDPWRTFPRDTAGIKVLHYGNTRAN